MAHEWRPALSSIILSIEATSSNSNHELMFSYDLPTELDL